MERKIEMNTLTLVRKAVCVMMAMTLLVGAFTLFGRTAGAGLIPPLAQAAPVETSASAGDATAGEASSEEPADENADEATDDDRQSFWEILASGGIIGLLIILLSIGTVALVIEHVMTIRAPVILPEDLAEQVREQLETGRYAEAVRLCRDDPSFLAQVLEAGIIEIEGGWSAVEKGVEDAMAEQSARLFRKIEYLSVIGNIAPMMGLLGTVVGMVLAFRELSISQGTPQAADLAEGIYQALITTVLGLIVAIPSLAAFAVFRNRVDYLVAEVAYVTQHCFGPVKRMFLRRGMASDVAAPRQTPPSPPPKGGKD